MAPPKNRSTKHPSPDTSAAVTAFMATLDHPHHAAVEAIRRAMQGAAPSIGEGIKWNAPSFRTHEYFATTHLRAKIGIGLILHLGAKVREDAAVRIEDPEGLLAWLGPDRAVVHFAGVDEVQARAHALQDVVRQWIAFV